MRALTPQQIADAREWYFSSRDMSLAVAAAKAHVSESVLKTHAAREGWAKQKAQQFARIDTALVQEKSKITDAVKIGLIEQTSSAMEQLGSACQSAFRGVAAMLKETVLANDLIERKAQAHVLSDLNGSGRDLPVGYSLEAMKAAGGRKVEGLKALAGLLGGDGDGSDEPSEERDANARRRAMALAKVMTAARGSARGGESNAHAA